MWIEAKGYSITDMTKKQAMKEGSLEALSPVTDAADLRCHILSAMDGRGCAFKVKRKGQLVGCYVLERETMSAAELNDMLNETADRTAAELTEGKDEQAQVLRLVSRAVLPEHHAALFDLEHSNDMAAELRNLLLDHHTKAVFFNDLTVTRSKTSLGGRAAGGLSLGIAFGLLFGIALKNIGLGLCFGVAFGACFDALASRKGA